MPLLESHRLLNHEPLVHLERRVAERVGCSRESGSSLGIKMCPQAGKSFCAQVVQARYLKNQAEEYARPVEVRGAEKVVRDFSLTQKKRLLAVP